ncbi:MAG: sugar phosphate isomerase/epimerase [Planctomycetaceae bacterium]|nr:sugar phosphate isomerase/epimerase [Planctomycetaceae bacterium]
MRFAICNETFQGWDFEKQCRRAAELGYKALEIAPFTLAPTADQVSAIDRATFKDCAHAHGLEIIGLHWLLAGTSGLYLTNPEKSVTDATVAYFHQLIDLCSDLGGSLMVLGSPKQRNLLPGVTHSRAMELAALLLRQLTSHLQDAGVTLAIEPLGPQEGDFLNTAESAVELIQMVDSSNVRLHLDVKAMSSEVESYESLILRHAAWLHHFHANDPNRQGPGMGEVDFLPILRALHEVGYHGWVSVEVFDYTPGPDALASQSIQYLQQTLARL